MTTNKDIDKLMKEIDTELLRLISPTTLEVFVSAKNKIKSLQQDNNNLLDGLHNMVILAKPLFSDNVQLTAINIANKLLEDK